MGDFYDLALKRGARISQLESDIRALRARFAELEQAIDERDDTILGLVDELAARDRTIDTLERQLRPTATTRRTR